MPAKVKTALTKAEVHEIMRQIGPAVLQVEPAVLFDIILNPTEQFNLDDTRRDEAQLKRFIQLPYASFNDEQLIQTNNEQRENFKQSVRLLIRLAALEQLKYLINNNDSSVDTEQFTKAQKRLRDMVSNKYPMMSYMELAKAFLDIAVGGVTTGYFSCAQVNGSTSIAGLEIDENASKYFFKSAAAVFGAYTLGKLYIFKAALWPCSHLSSTALQQAVSEAMCTLRNPPAAATAFANAPDHSGSMVTDADDAKLIAV